MQLIDTEDALSSCRTILHFIENAAGEFENKKKRALMQDLFWKSKDLKSEQRLFFLAKGMSQLFKKDIEELVTPDLLDFSVDRHGQIEADKRFDVGIVTIHKPELEGVLMALGLNPNGKDYKSCGQDRYWFSNLDRGEKRPLSVVITIVGRPRNVPCAIAVDRLLSHYSVDTMLLVGIAAGLEGKVNLGDAVCAERIIDYEHARQEMVTENGLKTKTARIRPDHSNLTPMIADDISFFTPRDDEFHERLQLCLSKMDRKKRVKGYRKLKPKCEKGTIAAGEKLIADGSLIDKRVLFDQRLMAADQEDSGFAQACGLREPRIPWAIFRGISDFGDPDKDRGENWQYVASASAAVVAVLFLQTTYRTPSR